MADPERVTAVSESEPDISDEDEYILKLLVNMD
jgi:hypothetical protein